MMDSVANLTEETILLELQAANRFSVFREMLSHLEDLGSISESQREEVYLQLKEREEQTTFAVGKSLAIPHINGSCVNKCVFVYARSKEGIEFGSCDTGLIHHVFLVLIPEDEKCGWLKTLAQMARSLSSVELRETLMELNNPAEVRTLLVKNLMR